MKKLLNRTFKQYEAGLSDIKNLNDIFSNYNKLHEQLMQQQTTLYLSAFEINKNAIYFIPSARKEINKYILSLH